MRALFKLFARALVWWCTTALVSLTSTAAPWDGPYVGSNSSKQLFAMWVESHGERLTVRQQAVAFGDVIEIPAAGARPKFSVKLRDVATPVAHTVGLAKDAPLFVMADTHGEFEIATELLLRHRVIDDQLRWSFGTGHLVVLGDVFDRGAHQTELLWLFYKLEAEAQSAGGGLHLVLGNHESMVLLGDERYLHPKYVQTQRAFNAPSYAALWGTNTVLGRWLRSKAAVMKLGEALFVHGGLSPDIVSRKLALDDLNASIRAALRSQHDLPSAPDTDVSFVLGPKGPLWHRGYFGDTRDRVTEGEDSAADIARVLEHFNARRIFVGHTRVPSVTALYDGKVIAVQVYPHRDERTGSPVMEGVLIERGRMSRASADGKLTPIETNTHAQ